jgi:endonuclease YncB( thermonuclease family)
VAGSSRDQHGRILGTLHVGDRNLNRELVADGWAWAFTGFAADDDLAAAEAAARRDRRGLWADPQPLAPGRWRELHPPHTMPRQP